MLSKAQIRSLRDLCRMMDGESFRIQALTLSLVLEDTAPFPPSNVAAKPEAPAEKTPEQRQIEDLQEALAATRERADRAELKYLELKRNG